ncbi:MAG: M42 family metallopeptidase [Caldanaerobacter subterraneus]|nr:M42 family metallopeptidase [Caldanaerobacter subterraneus]
MSVNVELIKKLTQAFGPSGSEDKVFEIIREEVKGFCDEITHDAMGNMICVKKGKGKKIMVAAHADEIGIMVTHIEEEGFLRFTTIGGVYVEHLVGRRVVFKNGTVGVIGVEHLEDKKDFKMEKLYIDIGVKDKKEAEELVKIGESGSFVGEFVEAGDRLVSKAFDDRIGCYVAIEALKNVKTENELYFVFTVQEEVGLRGATTAAYSINPDFAIAVDVTATGDTPKAKKMAVAFGKGAAIKVMDRSIIVSPSVRDMMIEVAKENSIPYQLEILEFGGTDAGAIHLSRGGVPSGVISIPTRYVHSVSEMVDKKDVEASINLLIKILEK